MNFIFRKIHLSIGAALLLAFFTSCISSKSLLIEIPVQARKELPTSIQSLTLVNRTVDSSFTNLKTDSLQRLFYNQSFRYDTVIKDIQASDTTLKALGELLFESGRYDFVIPENRFLAFEKNAFLTKEMPWAEVKETCEVFNTDAVLSLDHFKTRVSTDFKKIIHHDSYSDQFEDVSTAEMKVIYEALFRVYDPQTEKVLVREFIRDTIMWEDAEYTTKALFRRFTPVKAALSEAGIAIALDFSEIISTSWRPEQRIFFIKGDDNLKQAALLIENQKWDAAMALWKQTAAESKSKSLKSKAEFNIAVGYEMTGELNQAISWGLKSYDTMYRMITYEYLEILEKRRKELKLEQR